MPSWPDTNTNPLAFTAWLYAPSATGASDVATASIFSLMTPHSPRVSAIIVCVATRLCTLTV